MDKPLSTTASYNMPAGPIGRVTVQEDGSLVWVIRSIEGGGVLGTIKFGADLVRSATAERGGVIRFTPTSALYLSSSQERAQKFITASMLQAEKFASR